MGPDMNHVLVNQVPHRDMSLIAAFTFDSHTGCWTCMSFCSSYAHAISLLVLSYNRLLASCNNRYKIDTYFYNKYPTCWTVLIADLGSWGTVKSQENVNISLFQSRYFIVHVSGTIKTNYRSVALRWGKVELVISGPWSRFFYTGELPTSSYTKTRDRYICRFINYSMT